MKIQQASNFYKERSTLCFIEWYMPLCTQNITPTFEGPLCELCVTLLLRAWANTRRTSILWGIVVEFLVSLYINLYCLILMIPKILMVMHTLATNFHKKVLSITPWHPAKGRRLRQNKLFAICSRLFSPKSPWGLLRLSPTWILSLFALPVRCLESHQRWPNWLGTPPWYPFLGNYWMQRRPIETSRSLAWRPQGPWGSRGPTSPCCSSLNSV